MAFRPEENFTAAPLWHPPLGSMPVALQVSANDLHSAPLLGQLLVQIKISKICFLMLFVLSCVVVKLNHTIKAASDQERNKN
jgi:hypothetical protein